VENGTGTRAAIEAVSVAGKTGTSQKPDSGGYSQTRSWSSFIGFAPAEKPVLLCGVLIDEPERGEMGGEAAAPYFKQIVTQVISHPELEFAEKILGTGDSLHAVTTVASLTNKRNKPAKKGSQTQGPKAEDVGTMPDCVGRNLHEAVNSVNVAGFRPFAVGYGIVEKQIPAAGAKPASAAACTLFCSIRGAS
jgi:cell division protein FtsI (penicillin-binding protein 3)